MRRLFFLATLAASVALSTDARSGPVTSPRIGGYTSLDPVLISVEYVATGGTTAMLTVTGTGTFTVSNRDFLIDPAGDTVFNNATFVLVANTMTAASTTPLGPNQLSFQEGFSGSFSLASSGNETILSGSFTDSGALSQLSLGMVPSPVIFSVDPAEFDSSIFLPTFDEQFALTLSGGVPLLIAQGGIFQDFTADVFTGDFDASVVPEPSTLGLAGLGALALTLAAAGGRGKVFVARSGNTA